MNNLDLELFEILKDEVDKTLSFGCFIEYKGKYEKIVSEYDGRYTTPTFFANADSEYLKEYCKVLGHYPTTNTIIIYLHKKDWNIDFSYDDHIELYNRKDCDKIFNLYIDKEIKYFSDEQKQELILFLKGL